MCFIYHRGIREGIDVAFFFFFNEGTTDWEEGKQAEVIMTVIILS